MVDEPAASTSKILDQPARSDETLSEGEEEGSDTEEEEDDEGEEEGEQESAYSSLKGKAPAKKVSLWTDEADENLTVSLQGTKRLRKLRTEASEDIVSGSEYERKLRAQ
jgi:U3 small nucleolar RNA-associated protein 18